MKLSCHVYIHYLGLYMVDGVRLDVKCCYCRQRAEGVVLWCVLLQLDPSVLVLVILVLVCLVIKRFQAMCHLEVMMHEYRPGRSLASIASL